MQADAWVALRQHVAVGPVGGGVLAFEQAGFGHQQRARAGRRDDGAPGMGFTQPGRFDPIASAQVGARHHEHLGDADDLRGHGVGDGGVGHQVHAVGNGQGLAVGRDDLHPQRRAAWAILNHQGPVAPHTHEHVAHAEQHRGRDLGQRQDGHGGEHGGAVGGGHGGFVGWLSDLTAGENGGSAYSD
ncbi:hypothetical protein D9M68_802370 [compost metagenome]